MRAAALLMAPLCAAQAPSVKINNQGCVVDYDSGLNYFPSSLQVSIDFQSNGAPTPVQFQQTPEPGSNITKIDFSELWSVEYHKTYKIVTVNNTRGSTPVPAFVLWYCGTPKPEAGAPGVPEGARYFEVPVKKAGFPGSVAVQFAEILGLQSEIDLIDMTYITSACLQKLETCDPPIEHHRLRTPGWTEAALRQELIFTDWWGTGATGTARDVPFDATVDPGPLHRAEWVKFMGLFFNQESHASTVFEHIKNDYQYLKNAAEAHASQVGSRKKVAWITYASWLGQYQIDNHPYKVAYVSDAGATAVAFPTVDNCTVSGTKLSCSNTDALKAALTAAGADVLIDESYAPDPAAYGSSEFLSRYGFTQAEASSFPFLANGHVFRLDLTHSDARPGAGGGQKGLAWFEQAVPNPHWVLSDLVRVLHGDDLTLCDRRFLRRIQVATHEPTVPVSHEHCQRSCAEVQQNAYTHQYCAPSSYPVIQNPMAVADAKAVMDSLVGQTVIGARVESVDAVRVDGGGKQSYGMTMAGDVADFTTSKRQQLGAFMAGKLKVSALQIINLQVSPASVKVTFDVFPIGYQPGNSGGRLSAAVGTAAAIAAAAAML
eukprot:TRINITY_DN349_c0_g1_i1.p1 TRINITY_DN349_c0_g1~~TRINITY_DN349_c0_g1_i1.p1  ORF type:complete len:626 (+),score=237.96 TRINITY_DN349_c0_g1_i1:75-1880(+)